MHCRGSKTLIPFEDGAKTGGSRCPRCAPAGSKTLIPLETSANSGGSKPPRIGTTKLENTDFARDVCKFWGFEATSVDQAQAQKRWFRSRLLQILWFRSHLDRSGLSSRSRLARIRIRKVIRNRIRKVSSLQQNPQ